MTRPGRGATPPEPNPVARVLLPFAGAYVLSYLYRSVNAVTSERLTDYGGGPTFYSCLVEVERIGD